MSNKIAILGDFNPAFSTHLALNESVIHCNSRMNKTVQCDWIPTEFFYPEFIFDGTYFGLWIAPGSPYKNMQNVIDAIQYTRLHNIPTFGNCGGFQHMLIEFARNCCGIENAEHEETNPDSKELIISKLSCSLVGEEEWISVTDKTSILFGIIRQEKILGKYYCSYGFNKKYLKNFEEQDCSFTAFSPEGEIRAFELTTHPFFLGTLFQPALTSDANEPNPIILEFFKRCNDIL